MHQFIDCNKINWLILPDDAHLIFNSIICLHCQDNTTNWNIHQQHYIKIGNETSTKRFICKKRSLFHTHHTQ